MDLAEQFKQAASDLKKAQDERDEEMVEQLTNVLQTSIQNLIAEQCKSEIERLTKENEDLRQEIEELRAVLKDRS